MRIPVRRIRFGDDDAKNEIQKSDLENNNYFEDYYLVNDSDIVEKFYLGVMYLVYGFKGTGKTAFLRYLNIVFSKSDDLSDFVLFKSHIKEADRAEMSLAAGASLADTSDVSSVQQNFTDVWEWYIHRRIVRKLGSDGGGVFLNDENWQKYYQLISSAAGQSVGKTISVRPNLKGGKLKVGLDLGVVTFDLEQNYDFERSSSKISLSNMVRAANDYISACKIGERLLFIFFDELEVFYGNREFFARDCRLIRDLLLSISNLNALLSECGFKVRLVGSVRQEVIEAIRGFGGEIQRLINDFGVRMRWDTSDAYPGQPILKMIEKRIVVSEKIELSVENEEDVWNRYVPNTIMGKTSRRFVLDKCNFRPRDAIRLLRLAAQMAGDRDCFENSDFSSIMGDFSASTWGEFTEDLLSGYSSEEISFVRLCLMGGTHKFNLEKISKRFDEKVRGDIVGQKLKEKIGSWEHLLRDLFRVGVIGNVYYDDIGGMWRNRWVSRGDEFLDTSRGMEIHDSLHQYLELNRPSGGRSAGRSAQ